MALSASKSMFKEVINVDHLMVFIIGNGKVSALRFHSSTDKFANLGIVKADANLKGLLV